MAFLGFVYPFPLVVCFCLSGFFCFFGKKIKIAGSYRSFSVIRCSYNGNGRGPVGDRGGGVGDPVENGVKRVEKFLEEKRRAELSARIASGAFTVEKTGYEYMLLL